MKKIQTFLEVQTQQTFYMINKTENLILFISGSIKGWSVYWLAKNNSKAALP